VNSPLSTKTGRVAAGGSLLVGGLASGLALAPNAGATPNTYHVTNLLDSGAGSLRQAVNDANTNLGADIIVFDASAAGTITLTTSNLLVTDSVTITGLGAASSTISGNNASRIFYLYNNIFPTTVSISGLTLTDGSAGFGGAIFNSGIDLTLSDLVISGNSATGVGGGISGTNVTNSGAGLTIIDSEISNNSSHGGGGGVYLYRVGDVTITNSVISGNTTENGRGGGLRMYHTGDVSLVGSTVNDNAVTSNHRAGGASLQDAGVVTIDATTFANNSSGWWGGGLEALAFEGFTMTNSTFSGNTAQGNSAFFISSGFNNALVANCTIANNTATASGGTTLEMDSYATSRILFSTISGNSSGSQTLYFADGDGGTAGSVNINGTIVSDNTTRSGTGTTADDIYSKSALTLTNSLVMGSRGSFSPITDGGGNVYDESAQLGALADNGGPTFTMNPASGSPVINAGPPLWFAFAGDGFDQRGDGYLRIYDGISDMGAVETLPDPTPPSTTTTTVAPGETTTTTTTVAPGETTTTTTTVAPGETTTTTTTVSTDPIAPAFTG